MYLETLELRNFRNFGARQFEFSPEVNIIYGPNAIGKTNLLEAIYVLSNLRSFRTHTLRDVLTWEQDQALVKGLILPGRAAQNTSQSAETVNEIENERREHPGKQLAVKVDPHARTAFLNNKPCRSSKDYLQVMPCTAFIPDDLDLVKGMPEARRLFLDRATFQYYPAYWSLLTEYNRLLQQKNALLREQKGRSGKAGQRYPPREGGVMPETSEDIWNDRMQQIGSKVIFHRLRLIQRLQKFVQEIYQQWIGSQETITVRYKSSVRFDRDDLPDVHELHSDTSQALYQRIYTAYGHAIEKNREREYRLGTTVVGPHRDDLDIDLWGRSLRSFGSQGQQRTAVLALKFAEVYVYFERYGEYSVLVLDDVMSELDDRRSHTLFDYVQHGMQVFISATSKPELPGIRGMACRTFALDSTGA